MADSIFNRYKGENGIREEEVDEHILFNTSFPPDKFLKKTLRWMEEKGLLANVKKRNGKNRRPGTFNEVYIDFDQERMFR